MNKERDKFLDKACTVALPETAEKVKTPVIWPRGTRISSKDALADWLLATDDLLTSEDEEN